jgi:O-acetyl-ADP-ribose deacetylase (regulator of RNase III)
MTVSRSTELARYLGGRVRVVVGNLTREPADAIVNAANAALLPGGGVCGAIHRAGGPSIAAECERVRRERYPNGLPTGEAVATGAGVLPARHVIHTVGPVYGEAAGREPELLAACYRRSIEVADGLGLASIAFPAISTGIFGYPPAEAAATASPAIAAALDAAKHVRDVRLVFLDPADAGVFVAHQRFSG